MAALRRTYMEREEDLARSRSPTVASDHSGWSQRLDGPDARGSPMARHAGAQQRQQWSYQRHTTTAALAHHNQSAPAGFFLNGSQAQVPYASGGGFAPASPRNERAVSTSLVAYPNEATSLAELSVIGQQLQEDLASASRYATDLEVALADSQAQLEVRSAEAEDLKTKLETTRVRHAHLETSSVLEDVERQCYWIEEHERSLRQAQDVAHKEIEAAVLRTKAQCARELACVTVEAGFLQRRVTELEQENALLRRQLASSQRTQTKTFRASKPQPTQRTRVVVREREPEREPEPEPEPFDMGWYQPNRTMQDAEEEIEFESDGAFVMIDAPFDDDSKAHVFVFVHRNTVIMVDVERVPGGLSFAGSSEVFSSPEALGRACVAPGFGVVPGYHGPLVPHSW